MNINFGKYFNKFPNPWKNSCKKGYYPLLQTGWICFLVVFLFFLLTWLHIHMDLSGIISSIFQINLSKTNSLSNAALTQNFSSDCIFLPYKRAEIAICHRKIGKSIFIAQQQNKSDHRFSWEIRKLHNSHELISFLLLAWIKLEYCRTILSIFVVTFFHLLFHTVAIFCISLNLASKIEMVP